MPAYFPENNTAEPFDNELRSLQKIVDLLGSSGSSAHVACRTFLFNATDGQYHELQAIGTAPSVTTIINQTGLGSCP